VGTPVELALPELQRIGRRVQGALAARVAENSRHLAAAVGPRSAVSVLASDGGWCAILRVPAVQSDEAWALALLSDGVLVQPGYFFDLRGGTFLVVSLLPPPDVFAEGIARLLKRVDVVQD
jgi:aspartate/methionine/tyrosine aminotransferase